MFMNRLGFCLDMGRCMGCGACQVACKERNKLPAGEFFRRSGIERSSTEGGPIFFAYSGGCNHCADPVCTAVCPTGAMRKAGDGMVIHQDPLCIGCGRCVYSCPYGAVSISRVTGYAQKCSGCAELRQRGEMTACTAACPMRALKFGELKQLEEECDQRGQEVTFLPPIEQTFPSLYIVNARKELSLDRSPCSSPTEEPIERPRRFRQDTGETFLILGGGAAAVSAAMAIRERNSTAVIHMLSNEATAPYCRPLLSKGLLRGFEIEKYPILTPEMMFQNQIELSLRTRVTQLDPAGHCVLTNNGERLFYDKCVYALGAEPVVPPIPGADKKGVYTLRKNEDVEKLRIGCLRARSAVVIGGGFIGLEAAWQLKTAGLEVTVLEESGLLMGRLVDRAISELIRKKLEDACVHIRLNTRVRELRGTERVVSVLADGQDFPADLVLLATGVRSNISLAAAAGLMVNRSLVVNAHMETGAEDIYACGDCAELNGINHATWLQAIRQGEVAGANAAGEPLEYHPQPNSVVVHLGDTALFSIGDLENEHETECEYLRGTLQGTPEGFLVNQRVGGESDVHLSLCFVRDRLTGLAMLGRLTELVFFQRAVCERQTREQFLAELIRRGMTFHAG